MINKVTSLLAEQLNIDAKMVKPTSRIVEDLGADSLDKILLLLFKQKRKTLNNFVKHKSP